MQSCICIFYRLTVIYKPVHCQPPQPAPWTPTLKPNSPLKLWRPAKMSSLYKNCSHWQQIWYSVCRKNKNTHTYRKCVCASFFPLCLHSLFMHHEFCCWVDALIQRCFQITLDSFQLCCFERWMFKSLKGRCGILEKKNSITVQVIN